MKETRKIMVSEFVIGEGRRFSKFWCPIAMAIRHALRVDVSVDLDTIRYGGLVINTPPNIQNAIVAFDMGQTIHPFVFEVPV